MSKRISSIKALDNFELLASFQNGISKRYDIKPLFDIFPQFKDLKTISGLFNQVKVDIGGYGISWNDELDLDANDIWEDGSVVGEREVISIADSFAVCLVETRERLGLTQKQLSERTGIYQADISKIERGLANPSLTTLKRLAEGMNMKIKIEFVEE